MNSMPSLSNSNRFAALLVEEVYESDSIPSTITAAEDTTAILTSPTLRSQFRKHPNWEKQLPKRYIVALNPSSNSFELLVSMQTLDMGEVLSTTGLLNCGAMDLFVGSDFVKQNHTITKQLS